MSLTKLSNPVAATPFNVFCAASNRGKPKQNIGNESGRKLNAAQTAIAINAANGNTIIYDKHFTIADDGISISAGMLWNSTEKKWRFAAGAATLQPEEAENVIAITEDDGRMIRYRKENSRYICLEPDDRGLSFLIINAGRFTRIFPDTGVQETFDAQQRLCSKKFPQGQQLEYVYDVAGTLKKITLPSGRILSVPSARVSNESEQLTLSHPNSEDKVLCEYQQDYNGSLCSFVKQPDGLDHKTSYWTTAATNELAIVSDDETKHILTFNPQGEISQLQEGNRQGEISQLQEANRQWTVALDKNSRTFKISADNGAAVAVEFDEAQHWQALKEIGETRKTTFKCDAAGRVETKTDPDGTQHQTTYNKVTGLISSTTNLTSGMCTTNEYEKDIKSSCFGVLLSQTLQDGQLSATTTYQYNERRQYEHEISPEGRKISYIYDKQKPHRIAEIRKGAIINQLGYDECGRVNSKAKISSTGEVLETITEKCDALGRITHTETSEGNIKSRRYDGLDRLRKVQENERVRRYKYLGNRTITKSPNGLQTDTDNDTGGLAARVVNAANNGIRLDILNRNADGSIDNIEYADGRKKKFFYDPAGRVSKYIKDGTAVVELLYDAHDHQIGKKRYDADQPEKSLTQYNLYDSDGQLRFEVTVKSVKDFDGKESMQGFVTEHHYRLGLRTETIQRNLPINPEQAPNLLLKNVIKKDVDDRITRYEHDGDGNMVTKWVMTDAEPEEIGYTQKSQYDSANHCTHEIVYLDKSSFAADLSKTNKLVTRHWYDAAGRKIATLDADKFLTGYTYDRDGRLRIEIAYSLRQDNIDLNAESIILPVPDNTDRLLRHDYDTYNRQFRTYDSTTGLESTREYDLADNVITETRVDTRTRDVRVTRKEYNAFNELIGSATERVCANMPTKIDWVTRECNPETGLCLYSKDKDGNTTFYFYNQNKLPVLTIGPDGAIVSIKYDPMTDKPAEVIKYATRMSLEGRANLKEQGNRSGYFDPVEHQALIPPVNDKDQHQLCAWATRQYNAVTGLCLSSKDELGNATYYFYGKNKKPVLTIGPDGAVVAIKYDLLTGKPVEVTAYSTPLTHEKLVALQKQGQRSGFFDSVEHQSWIPAVDDKDRQLLSTYDAEGLLIEITKENKARTFFTYNSFAERNASNKEIDANKFLLTKLDHDLRGNISKTEVDPAKLAITTSAAFNDPLNRCTSTKSASGLTIKTKFEGLRKQTQIDKGQPERKKTTTQDAFKRPKSETDWTNKNAQNHVYEDIERRHILISPVSADRNIEEVKNAFDEIVNRVINGKHTVMERDIDGQLKAQHNPDGSSVLSGYDIRGYKNESTSASGLRSKLHINATGQHTGMTDYIDGTEIESSLTRNAFNEIDSELDAERKKKKHVLDLKNNTQTDIVDPDGLHLIKSKKLNLAGHLLELCEGDKDNPSLYREVTVPDMLGREEKKWIEMEDGKKALVHETTFDKMNHPVEIKDAKGGKVFHVYDKRGNLRYSMDAAGYLIERSYDANNHEITVRQYSQTMTSDIMKTLPVGIIKSDYDAISHKIHDADGLPIFEIKLLDVESGIARAAVTEQRYDGMNKQIEIIQYAKTINLNQVTLDDIPAQLKRPEYANDSLNRVTIFKRDPMGRRQMIINGESNATELRRDLAGNVIAKIKYAKKYSDNALQDIIDPENRINFRIYDKYGNVRFKIDGEGYIRETRYNKAHVKTDRITYATRLNQLLSIDELAQLNVNLLTNGIVRDTDAILKLLETTVTRISDPKHDVHEVNRLDNAHRVKKKIDGEKGKEKFTLNAHGKWLTKTDKRKNLWKREYHKDKSLSLETTPQFNITQVTADPVTHNLAMTSKPDKVDSKFDLDESRKSSAVTIANNLEMQKRTVISSYDQNELINGTLLPNVLVDNGDTHLPDIKQTYSEIKSLTTKIIRDFAGREIVNINEKGIPSFTIHDAGGNKRFTVSTTGTVIEYQYQYGFKKPDQVITYATQLDLAIMQAFQNGLPINMLRYLISKFDHTNDRCLKSTYDRNGNNLTTKNDGALVGVVTKQDENTVVKGVEFERETEFKYNAFNEVIAEHCKRAMGQPDQITQRFHDRNGNETMTISPHGYATMRTFGIQGIVDGKKHRLQTGSREYYIRLPYESRTTLTTIIKTLREYEEWPEAKINDRITRTEYDRRYLSIKSIIADGHPFFRSETQDSKTIQIHKANPVITTMTIRDEEGKPIAYVKDNGDKRYLVNNAMGDPVFETEFPVSLGAGKVVVPVFQHFYNAHRQPVGTIKYKLPGNIVISAKDRLQITGLVTPSTMDELSLVLMCQRGLPIITQGSMEGLKFTTYNETKQIIRSYRLVTVFDNNITNNNSPSKNLVLRAHRREYDNGINVAMQSTLDGIEEHQVHRKFNAFAEVIAEGPSKKYVLFMSYDKCGNKYFTNEDRAIATIAFFDESRLEVVSFRSAIKDLLLCFKDNLAKAGIELLAEDYEKTFHVLQRYVTFRNDDGQAIQQDTPWFTRRPAKEPQNYNVQFSVVKRGDKNYLRFVEPDQRMLSMEYKIRNKGKKVWEKTDERTIQLLEDYDFKILMPFIDISDLPSDAYEYCLNLYYTGELSKERDAFPSFRAEGEVMLDTGNYEQSTQPIWYFENSHTLVIAGKNKDVSGIELIRKDQPAIRIAATRFSDGRLKVNLANEVESEYDFRLVLGSKVILDDISVQNSGKISVRIFEPEFHFSAANLVIATPGTIPPELIGKIKYEFGSGAQPVPFKFARAGGGYQVGDNDNYFFMPWGFALPSVYITARDQQDQQQFLGAFPAMSRYLDKPFYRFSNNYKESVFPVKSAPFMTLQNHTNTPVHALGVSINGVAQGQLQVQSWLGGYIPCDKLVTYPATNVRLAAISLAEAPVSELMGTFTLGTLHPGEMIAAEEICISEFNIEQYKVGGFEHGVWWNRCSDIYNAYHWKSTTNANHALRVTHTSVNNAVITDFSSMRLSPNGQNKMFFQTMVPIGQNTLPTNLFLELYKEGDFIPLCFGENQYKNEAPRDREIMERYGDGLTMSLMSLSKSYFADYRVMYFKRFPEGTKKVIFEYLFSSSHDEKNWRTATCHMTTAGGLSVFINNMPVGIYSCRFRVYANVNAAEHDVMKTNDPRFIQDADGYCYLTMPVKKGMQNGQVFSNTKRPVKLEVVKPNIKTIHDRWNNLRSIMDRTKHLIEQDFNLLNQLIKTTTQAVKSIDKNGHKTLKSLVTENLMNTDGHMVAQISPAEGMKKWLPNSRGQNIMIEDEDGVTNLHVFDIMRKCVSTTAMSRNTITSSFTRENGLLVETRQYMDKTTEVITYNEEMHPISITNRLGYTTWLKPDEKGRCRLQINPKLKGQTQHNTREQDFHQHSGAMLRTKDEDDHVQLWATDPNSAADDYVGNIASHTDLAGQVITYTLNCNKQIIYELGKVDEIINQQRGYTDTHHTSYPAAHELQRLLDEAGHEIDLIDKGANLTTSMEYDEEDYCISYYFMSNNGRVYQATNIIFDELHRIHKMLDTHIMIKLGYDQNSNRRFAKAYAIGENSSQEQLHRESWYDYSLAGRVFLRDCVLKAQQIVLEKGQGMALKHEKGLVVKQTSLTDQGVNRVNDIHYNEEDLVDKIVTTEDGKETKTEIREIAAARLKKRLTSTGENKTTEIFDLDTDDSTLSQKTIDTKDGHETQTVRKVDKKTGTGRTLQETMTTHMEVGTEGNEGSIDITDTINTMYIAAGSFTVRAVVTDRKIETHGSARADQADPKAELQTTQDANGMPTSVQGATAADQKANKDAYRKFVVNSENCILLKETKDGRNYYFYAQKTRGKTVMMAYFGDLSDSVKRALKRGEAIIGDKFNPLVFNIDVNHQPLSPSYPAPYPGCFKAPRDMTYDEIADELNYTGFGEMIANANQADAGKKVTAGTLIKIPPMYFEVPETAWNGSMPAIESLLGTMYPSLSAPHISLRPHQINWLETMVEVAAGAAIMLFAPYAIAAVMGYALASAPALVVAASYGASAALANATTQGIAIGLGSQQKFDFKAMATQAIAAAVTAGVASKVNSMLNAGQTVESTAAGVSTQAAAVQAHSALSLGSIATHVITTEMATLAQQAVLMGLGWKHEVDGKGFVTAAFNSVAGDFISAKFTDDMLATGTYTAATNIGDTIIRGERINTASLSAATVGSMLGSYVGK